MNLVDCSCWVSEPNESARASQFGQSIVRDRLAFWRGELPTVRWNGILSSRLGRRLDLRVSWFRAFREACFAIQRADELLVTSAKSTTGKFAMVATNLFAMRILGIHLPPPRQTIEKWTRMLTTLELDELPPRHYELWLSPRIRQHEQSDEPCAGPLRDRAVVTLADRLFVLHVRRGGNIERLIRARLNSALHHAPNVYLAIGRGLVDDVLADEFIALGATAWIRDECRGEPADNASAADTPFAVTTTSLDTPEILELDTLDDDHYLTHCTRAAQGPWPDQTETDYLEELVRGSRVEPRTPLASLSRIVHQQCLWASGRGIRGKVRVVCWTALGLSQLARHRVFRSHRGRWDFEPYGISVQRNWLTGLGARPVIYGDEHNWQQLTAADRPFFQFSTSRARNSATTLDWTAEQEWRLLGDLSLRQIPASAARLFVPTRREAEQLVRISRWPVVVLPE